MARRSYVDLSPDGCGLERYATLKEARRALYARYPRARVGAFSPTYYLRQSGRTCTYRVADWRLPGADDSAYGGYLMTVTVDDDEINR